MIHTIVCWCLIGLHTLDVAAPPSAAAREADPVAPAAVADGIEAPDPLVPAGVDLEDESTWAALSVEEKDRIRALRASRQADSTDPQSSSATVEPPSSAPPPRLSEYAQRQYRVDERQAEAEAWKERDQGLIAATAVTASISAVALVIAIALRVSARNAASDCANEIAMTDFGAGSSMVPCVDEAKAIDNRLLGSKLLFVLAGGAGAGAIVAGSFLGAHRARKPTVGFSLLGLQARF